MTHSSSDSDRGRQPSAWSFDLIGHLASLESDSLPHCSRFQSIATARDHLVAEEGEAGLRRRPSRKTLVRSECYASFKICLVAAGPCDVACAFPQVCSGREDRHGK
jgi:hypothetical protein